MIRLVTAIVLVLFVLFLTPVSASNDAVKICTTTQIKQIVSAVQESDFAAGYQVVVDNMGKVGDDTDILYAMIEDMSTLQSTWWGDVANTFPDCALANELAFTGGRMLDELLIAVSVARVGYSVILDGDEDTGATMLTRFQYHLAEWKDLQEDFISLISDLSS